MDGSASQLKLIVGEVPSYANLAFAPARVLATQTGRPSPRHRAGDIGLALAVHGLFAAFFAVLLATDRVAPELPTEIPVEIVARMPGEEQPRAEPGPPPPAPQAKPTTGTQSPARPASPPPPAFVAPPPEPAAAAARPEPTVPANAVPDRTAPATIVPDTPPPEAPKVLTSADTGTFAVAPKAEPKPVAAPQPAPSAADRPQDPSAKLAAAFPTNIESLPGTFRAVLSAAGTQDSAEYKGLVFGRLGRSSEISARARALHLRGHVIVAFSIADDGRLASASIAMTSGNPAVDALALDMVRAAAPFPPPPPGATRDFTPALSFGD